MSHALTLDRPAPSCLAGSRPLEVEFAGCRFRLSADTPEGQDRLDAVFGYYRAVGGPEAKAGIEVSLADGAPRLRLTSGGRALDLEALISGPDWRRFVPLPHPTRRLFGERHWGEEPILEALPDGLAVLRRELWPRYAQLAFIWLVLRERPVMGLHAAVSALEGQAVALVGPSGCGKSTLSWALHSLGAQFFGDECAFFTLPEYEMHVLRRQLCLRPGGMEALGSPLASPSWHEIKPGDPKCAVTLPEPETSCPRDRVILLFVDGFSERPEMEPMKGSEAVQRVIGGMLSRDPSLLGRLDLAAGLVDRYPCFRLKIGPPAETAALVLSHPGARR